MRFALPALVWLLPLAAASLLAPACGDSDDASSEGEVTPGNPGGSSGASGSSAGGQGGSAGGSAGKGGSAGAGGVQAGNAGSAGAQTAGSAGSAGAQAGSAGSAGAQAASAGAAGAQAAGSAGSAGSAGGGQGGAGQAGGGQAGKGQAGSAQAGSQSGGSGGAGQGGGSSAAPQCDSDASVCKVHSDCCHCVALAPGEEPPPCDVAQCKASACELLGNPEASCDAGQCTLATSCDASKVKCKSLPPTCPKGMIAAVDEATSCWKNQCIPATECSSVGSCDDCTKAGLICVSDVAFTSTTHCVAVPEPCSKASCGCMGPAVCVGGFDLCIEPQSPTSLLCECPTC